jgi:hypothetical protein
MNRIVYGVWQPCRYFGVRIAAAPGSFVGA